MLGDNADSDAGENNGNKDSSSPNAPKKAPSSNADNRCVKVIDFMQVEFQKIGFQSTMGGVVGFFHPRKMVAHGTAHEQ